MEVDEIQTPQQACKYSVNSNGKMDSSKIATGEDESRGGINAVVPTTNAVVTGNGSGCGVGGDMVVGSSNRFGRQWQHSSRIIRVSRASGGKDRHSKVWTAKGPRDRRVRLSVTTAIQFYDLQDRLGYDQPSKAVEWLIKAAADSINELPSLNTSSFPPETPRQLSDERRVSTNVVDSAEMELDGDPNNQQQMGSKSGCSSNNSETNKGSGLSLSQKEIRNKARERARERTAKEKERDGEPSMLNVGSHHVNQQHQQNVSSIPQTSSFTQLLTGGMSNLNESNNGGASSSPSPHHGSGEVGLFHKHSRGDGNQWLSSASSTTSMADYFGAGLMSLSSSRVGQVMTLTSFGGLENQQHHEQHIPFVSDQHQHHHLIHTTASGASGRENGNGHGNNNYNLNFTMSSSSTATPSLTAAAAAGFNSRGTLQSNNNSPSLVMPYLQRFSADGSVLPFFLGSAAAVSSASPTVEHFQPPGLQLCYGDNGPRQTDHKGKGKN